MSYKSRQQLFTDLFPKEPSFRFKQVEQSLFADGFKSFAEVSNLPKGMREVLQKSMPWVSFKVKTVLESSFGDTFKVILEMHDGALIETVLMANRRGQWTICVSSQMGCAMGCLFCATGKMGLKRSLDSDEIVDQYRFWRQFLQQHPDLPQRISNVVFMGMGEPLANYDNVKKALRTWLKYTDLGEGKLTVSTVGLMPQLEKMLDDSDWPHVKLAISLHSADPVTRKEIVPTSYEDFLEKLQNWGKRYLQKLGNRHHYLTFEYVMLRDVNDTLNHAQVLAKFAKSLGDVKVNLIPYNFTDSIFQRSLDRQIAIFKSTLEKAGVTVTVRKTMGDDIAAACGQLITMNKP